MKVGTAETSIEEKKKRERSSRLTSGTGSNGGNRNRGGGSNGGDDNNQNNDFFEDTQEKSLDKVRTGMWFLLLVVMMTFGGLISAYIVISTNHVLEWKPFDLPPQIWISTALILASSVSYKIAQKALHNEKQQKAKNWLLATTLLGSLFISSQILAWFELVRHGVYVQSNQYAGFFYILTAVHAIHVIGGICGLGYILLRAWHVTGSTEELTRRKSISKIIGWYWHLMDGLWVVLFLLLGFWK
ncbi:MAG: cytochrome c oxidase subunit 3 [Acidobacteria bacterium]|nr:cytochrome c oxidase subunit 3 [Acidobacteriota bacterium]MCA1640123.1 cytochrome c oxidase subunit 3 [Acidobacteriota bacterium]